MGTTQYLLALTHWHKMMMEMSKMMSHGDVSEKEMAPIEEEMMQMRNSLSEMEEK